MSAASLRRRLMLQLLAVAALLSVLMYFTIRYLAEGAAVKTQDNIIGASAASIVDEARAEDGDVFVDIPYSALSMLGAVSDDRVFYRVLADGRTVTGYDDLPYLAPPEPPARTRYATTLYKGEEVRIAATARRIFVDGAAREVVALVAQTRRWQAGVSTRISISAAAFGVGFFLIAALLSWFATERALKPLSRMATLVRHRGPQDLRPVRADAPKELAPLLDSLNSFMGRLRTALARTEEFIAEAAHRVRTPLATVRMKTEIALRSAETPASRRALRDVLRAVDESSRSAGQLLDHATVRLRSDRLERELVDLGHLVRQVVRALQPTAEMKDIVLGVEAAPAPAPVKGDTLLLDAALRNLLDNAIKYSPDEGAVRVVLDVHAREARVSIHDQGRGFGGASAAHLLRRFQRGDNVSDVIGSGLGLNIAHEAALAHGGRLELKQHEEGPGACVSLILPLASLSA